MALINRPASVLKATPSSITLDLVELAALDAIPAGYYKNSNNWKEVHIKYQHSGSKQSTAVVIPVATNVGPFFVSGSSRAGFWKVESVLIKDFDGGHVLISKEKIPSVGLYDVLVTSNATHGDIIIGNGEVLTISGGSKKQYGDFIIASGGELKIQPGGAITEIEVLGICQIDGKINGTFGEHTGGTWNTITSLNENISYTITQGAGGNGGNGESLPDTYDADQSQFSSGSYEVYWDSNANQRRFHWGDECNVVVPNAQTSLVYQGYEYSTGSSQINGGSWGANTIIRKQILTHPGGLGAVGAATGNGGGGGRSARFGALGGESAALDHAGLGAGQDDPAAVSWGEAGAHSATQSEAASGGFRGRHGQAIYLKAQRIDGSGIIDVSGQAGGQGGNGAEYLSNGILYANGAGGGAAGGSGGKVWLRYKMGTPALTINVAGGERGSAGFNPPDAGQATNGEAGLAGSTSIATY